MAGTNTEKPTGIVQQKKVVTKTKEVKQKVETVPAKKEETKPNKEEKVEKKNIQKIKKDFAKVEGRGLPVSTKVAVSICNFIRYKPIKMAISDLEDVAKLKRAVPMKGEIPHRKGRIMSGRFPKKAAQEFLVIVKSLQSNAIQFDIEEPIIAKAIANMGSRPFAKGGRARKKSTHVTLVATKKESIKKEDKKQ